MSLLLFSIDETEYVIDTYFVLRIIPKVFLQEKMNSSSFISGFINIEGVPIPVLDFCQLIKKRPAKEQFASRIIILQNKKTAPFTLLGLLVENATDFIPIYNTPLFSEKIYQQMPFMEGIYQENQKIIQKVNVNELFNLLEK